jgi:rhodanese-related sulfurtransferase
MIQDTNMNKIQFRLSVLTFLAGMLALTSVQAGNESAEAVAKIDVNSAQAYVAQHENAVILDVRTPAEYDMSHITGAVNVNVQNDDFATLVAGLDKDKTYLVHCTKNPANGRSARALETLQELGFRNLYNLEGGYIAWKEAELPLTEADN